jgi:UDP-GlcNAc:undecaprenyl-phosphate/decaprenyl-phosphate GlcNAc-1-phosphate transferase
MRIVFYVAVVAIAAVVTFTVAYAIWKLSLKYRLYPKIRERDVHTRPTPRLGGVAMFFGVLAAFGVASSIPQLSLVFADGHRVVGLLAAALIIVALGVADDIYDLDWMTKLAGQIIAAGILAWQGVQLTTLPIGGVTIVSPYVSLTLTILAVVLVMNAINFIDGLDGLVAGVAIIANGVFFIYSYLLQLNEQTAYFNLASLTTAVLIGACLGLLPLNFHPARLFMGDAGALLVGLMMAASAISVTGSIDSGILGQEDRFSAYLLPAYIPLLLPFAVLIVPLLDFTMAVLRRMRAGKSPFTADRGHLHHRLLDMGHTHLHAVLIFYGWTFVFSVGVLAFMFLPATSAGLLLAIGLAVCTIVTLAPLSRRKALEAAAQSADADTVAPEVARFDTLDEAHDDSLDDADDAELDTAAREDRA